MTAKNYNWISEIEKAEHALMIYPENIVTNELLISCINMADKGTALELFLNVENKLFLEKNPFLFNKCCQLVNKGGSIFLVANNAEIKYWKCVIDFKEFIYYSVEENKVIHEKDQDLPVFQNALIDFERKKQEGTPYLVAKGDIQIRISLSQTLIMKGDTTELFWEVDGADKVIIQGLGEVEAYGRKKIKPEKDTILKIGASNERQFQIKAIPLKVSQADQEISYDIGYISAGTKQYCSLVNSDIHPHVYGISKGNEVKLTWKVPNATEVRINPFNSTGATGELSFTPSASLTIEIQAVMINRTYSRKIQLLLFPIPLFKENLISVFPLATTKYSLPVPTVQKEQTEHIRKAQKQEYLNIRKEIFEKYSSIRSKKITLNNLKKGLFNFLKDKYSHRTGILKAIHSIQSYYEQSPSERRTE